MGRGDFFQGMRGFRQSDRVIVLREQARSHLICVVHKSPVGAGLLAKAAE